MPDGVKTLPHTNKASNISFTVIHITKS